MSFSEEERRAWHAAKKLREARDVPPYHEPPVATCIHCNRPFGITEGGVTEDVALCDICNGD